ncbi:MAG: hypothetical protein NT123_05135 [Proteobacteria bacterium]|nr:hypothetical protein [Pseudomonadota bacterium]
MMQGVVIDKLPIRQQSRPGARRGIIDAQAESNSVAIAATRRAARIARAFICPSGSSKA